MSNVRKIKVVYKGNNLNFSVIDEKLRKEKLKQCCPDGYLLPLSYISCNERCFLEDDDEFYYLEKDVEKYELDAGIGMK